MVETLQIFKRGKRFTTRQLKERFENKVSLRLIQKDLKELESAGILFVHEKGQGNEKVWSIPRKFRMNINLPLGKDEYLSTLLLKDALKVLKGTSIENASHRLSQQLDSLLPDELLDEIGDFKESNIFENIERGAYDYNSFNDVIKNVIHAILNRNKCAVKYLHGSTGEMETYIIEPRKMLQYDGALYIAAYRRDEEMFVPFAIHRIKDLRVLDEVFPITPRYDSAKFRKGRFGIFGSDNLEQIELKFDAGIDYHIEGRIWDESQEIRYDSGGNLILSMEIGITPELVSWILGWGKYCRILKPESLKSNVGNYH